MFGTTIPVRVIAIPAMTVLVIGIAALSRSPHRPAPKLAIARPVVPPPAPPPLPLPVQPTIDPAPIAPAIDVVAALREIGVRALTPAPAANVETGIPAVGPCTRPNARRQVKLHAQLAAWIDRTYGDEVANAAEGLELAVGCDDPDGLIVNAHVDRKPKGEEYGRHSRWWMLRVLGDTVTVLRERTSTAVDDWMEWADEGTLGAAMLVDLDRDGVRDVVWIETEHEGGASRSNYDVSAMLSKSGTTPIIRMYGELELQLAGSELVFALGDNYEHLAYRCLGADLKLVSCAAGERARARDEANVIASRYAAMIASEVPDRDLLAEELTKLGVAAGKRAPLVAAVPETRPDQRAQRHVARFVAKARPDDELSVIVDSPHVEAQTYFAAMRSQLGDTSCTATAPSKADTARIDAWIAARPSAVKGKHDAPTAFSIVPACGPYVWIAWEEWTAGRATNTGVRHEVLIALGDTLTRVLGFDFPATGDPQTGPGTAHSGTFFRHGDTIVGEVLHLTDDRTELFAIADGRVVAKRSGAFESYTYDSRWSDTSDDLIVESHAVWWHATPTGLERIDPEPLQAHEARRAALELLDGYDPIHITIRDDYVRALKALGAARALVREVAGL